MESQLLNRDHARCAVHGKKFEAFCMECGKTSEPMCSICLCAHNEKHFTGNAHISTVVKREMDKFTEAIRSLDTQSKQLQTHSTKLEEGMKKKEEIKKVLEKKLEGMQKFVETQTAAAKEQNAQILSSHESVLKEIKTCENRIKENHENPQRIQQQIEDMTAHKQYWEAFREIERALKQDAALDESEITQKFGVFEEMLGNYQAHLDEVEKTAALAIPVYQLLDAEDKGHIGKKVYTKTIEEIKGLKTRLGESEKETKAIQKKFEELEEAHGRLGAKAKKDAEKIDQLETAVKDLIVEKGKLEGN